MSQEVFWLRWLPPALKERLRGRVGLQSIIVNIGWLFFDKLLRLGIGLLVGVWVARYLGPDQFGLFNYATAIVALFTAVASLGLNNIVVRDLVKNPESAGVVLGSALLLQVIGGFIAMFFAFLAIYLLRPDDQLSIVIVVIFSFSMIFKSAEALKYWFESVVSVRYVVWAENAAFMTFAAVKILLILNNASLILFVWAATGEVVLVGLLFFAVYQWKGPGLQGLKVKSQVVVSLLKSAWPLILSGLATMIYMRIDQVMLGQLGEDKDVGIYSAALRLSEVWYFIPMAIVASLFPAIINAKENGEGVYYDRLDKLFKMMVVLALAVAIPISFFAGPLILFLYGDGYEASALVLIVHVWSGVFVFLGVASSRWFVVEDLQRFTFYRTLAGCLINIILNFALIPNFGAVGAACASVVSQAMAGVIFNALNMQTRRLFFLQMRAIFFFIPSKRLFLS